MRIILSEWLHQGLITFLHQISIEFKTKEPQKLLMNLLSMPKKTRKRVVIVLAEKEENKQEKIRAFRNLPYISLTDSHQVNFSHLFNSSWVIFSCEQAIVELEKRLI